LIGSIAAFVIGLFGLQFCGIIVATYSGQPDFIAGTAAIGIGLLVTICSIVTLMTTQDNNVYAASLALQNIFRETKLYGKVKHKWIAVSVSACAAILGYSGALKYFLPIVKALGVFIGPIPGLLIAEYYFVKKSKASKDLNIIAIISWFGGALAGYISLRNNFFISAVIGLFVTMILYVILSKLFDDTLNKDIK
jgi:cytosine permease